MKEPSTYELIAPGVLAQQCQDVVRSISEREGHLTVTPEGWKFAFGGIGELNRVESFYPNLAAALDSAIKQQQKVGASSQGSTSKVGSR